MQRREALRLLFAGGVLPAVPGDLFGFFRDSHPASGYELGTLDPHQNELVVAMIDQIIPATETPGAKAARVKQSNTLFGKNFADASADQQVALLRSLDEAAAVARARLEHKTRPPFWKPEGRDLQMQDDFFTVFKKMTVHGYYTSEIGFHQELKLEIMPGAQRGCVPSGLGSGNAEG
jgi:hypothetical protein